MLIKTHQTDSGLEIVDAVHRVTAVGWTENEGTPAHGLEVAHVTVSIYKDVESLDAKRAPVDRRTIVGSLPFDKHADQSIHTQIYSALKALPEYEDAQDLIR